MGKVRLSEEEPSNQDLLTIQKIQNKLARMLNNVRLSDKISSKTLLTQINMLPTKLSWLGLTFKTFKKIDNVNFFTLPGQGTGFQVCQTIGSLQAPYRT